MRPNTAHHSQVVGGHEMKHLEIRNYRNKQKKPNWTWKREPRYKGKWEWSHSGYSDWHISPYPSNSCSFYMGYATRKVGCACQRTTKIHKDEFFFQNGLCLLAGQGKQCNVSVRIILIQCGTCCTKHFRYALHSNRKETAARISWGTEFWRLHCARSLSDTQKKFQVHSLGKSCDNIWDYNEWYFKSICMVFRATDLYKNDHSWGWVGSWSNIMFFEMNMDDPSMHSI